jgi:glycosyltransferase involved in cell wall biosynthesis
VKIGINLNGFWPGKIGGAETYIRNLIEQLQHLDTPDTYSLLCSEEIITEIPLFDQRFSVKLSAYRKSSTKKFIRSLLWNTIKIDILQAEPRYLNYDVVHHPFSLIRKGWERVPSVLTFLDMQHEFYPEYFSVEELRNRREDYRRSAKAATRIIAISQHAKQSLIDHYGVSEEKIDVVYLGSSQAYGTSPNTELMAAVCERFSLTRPFLYYPAATWPHKNHKNLLAALKVMIERYGFDGELVLTGVAANVHQDVLAEIARLGLTDRVRMLGNVDYEVLPLLYALARVMVFPSMFEGFGIPLVEAMSSGCPVACSNAASIPEVVGDAAAMFDPRSIEEMAEVVWRIWESDVVRSGLIEKGLQRARLFDWQEMARQTTRVYVKAVG